MGGPNCNLFEEGKIPPCSNLLGSDNPIIKDGKVIFRNFNRFFYFISLNSHSKNPEINLNIQISLYNYLIGLFLILIEQDQSEFQKKPKIHDDEQINNFIYECLEKPPLIKNNFDATLILTYSNQNAILNPFTYNLKISPLSFLILFVINRFENHPGLFFVNNSYVTEDLINYVLAEMHFEL